MEPMIESQLNTSCLKPMNVWDSYWLRSPLQLE